MLGTTLNCFPPSRRKVPTSCNPPLIRQEWLDSWFGVQQESISRWQAYHR